MSGDEMSSDETSGHETSSDEKSGDETSGDKMSRNFNICVNFLEKIIEFFFYLNDLT